MIIICPDCKSKEEISENSFIHNKSWGIKNSHKNLKYIKKCNCCSAPIHINEEDYTDLFTTNTLIDLYGKECLW